MRLLFRICFIVFFGNVYGIVSAQVQDSARLDIPPAYIQMADTSVLVSFEPYLRPGKRIYKVTAEGYNVEIINDFTLRITPGRSPELLHVLKVESSDSTEMFFLLRKSLKRKVTLKLRNKTARSVLVAGDMNQWWPNATPMKPTGDGFETTLLLNPGKYAYKFVVDGDWQLDPGNDDKENNGSGSYNSVLKVSGPDREKLPFMVSEYYEFGKFNFYILNSHKEIYAFWQNTPASVSRPRKGRFMVDIPDISKKYKRSYLRLIAYNDEGCSNDMLIPLEYGEPVMDHLKLDRTDWQTMRMYFVLTDRFNNGDKSNDAPLKDKRISAVENFQGGDIKGISAKIKDHYFTDLGINTLWISPIVQNPQEAWQEWPEPRRWYSGYHGYWPVSSTLIDKRFGTEGDFKQLVQAAHGSSMNVLLDFVSHHVHQSHHIYKEHPEWFTSFILSDGRKNIRLWDEQRLTTWFDNFLPTFDFNQKQVLRYQADSAIYWLKKYDLDGFRHDASKHVTLTFWSYLTSRMRKQVVTPMTKPLFQIGETFGSRELIGSYVSDDKMNGQFDFNLYFDSRDIFAKPKGDMVRLKNSVDESLDYYGWHHLMGEITGNHDLCRFMGLASGAVSFDEDPKMAGYNRKIEVVDKIGYQRMGNLMAFIHTIPGVPVIYYGDEIGMVGAGDPDGRRFMRFDQLNHEESALLKETKRIVDIRKNNMALIYGDMYTLHLSEDCWVFMRTYFDRSVIVAFNSGESKTLTLEMPDWIIPNEVWYSTDQDIKIGKKKNLSIFVPSEKYKIFYNH